MTKPKLTVKQDAFVKAYLLNGGNATQAALKAGYSAKTAGVIGLENLGKPIIREAIEKHQKKKDDNFIYSKDKKLKLLEEIMFACMESNASRGMVNTASAIAAIKEHNSMQGDNAPTETITRAVKSFGDMYGDS